MFDYEGSRSEFLKLLAECGEEPAFIARARAPQLALDAMLSACEAKRHEMLKWPGSHLAALAQLIQNDWARIGTLLADPETVGVLKELALKLPPTTAPLPNYFATNKSALRQFLESAERFNRNWRTYIEGVDLEIVNVPRRKFNEFYALEKSCAFGSEHAAADFKPLAMIDRGFLYERFPPLKLPSVA